MNEWNGTTRKLGYCFLFAFYSNGRVFIRLWDIHCQRMVWPWKLIKGCSRPLKVAPFDRPYTIHCWSAVVSIALSCIISEIKWDIGNQDFFHTPLHWTLHYGSPCRNISILLGTEILEWWGYVMVKIEDMSSSGDRISACDGQTDRQTSCNGIVRAFTIAW